MAPTPDPPQGLVIGVAVEFRKASNSPYLGPRRLPGQGDVKNMISIPIAAAIGATIGAIGLGVASAATGDVTGLSVALGHIPSGTHGFDVVSTVANALAGGAAGGGIGAAVAAVAKSLAAH